MNCGTVDAGYPHIFFEQDCLRFCDSMDAVFCDFSAGVGCKYTIDYTCVVNTADATNLWKNF